MGNKPGKGHEGQGSPVADAKPASKAAINAAIHDAVWELGSEDAGASDEDRENQRLVERAQQRRMIDRKVMLMNLNMSLRK